MSIATLPPPASSPRLMTEEEFFARHGSESRVELLDGRLVRYPMPGSPHGYIGNNLAFEVTLFARQHGLGRVFGLDTFLRIRRNPDRVRGVDMMFVSFSRLAADQPVPAGVMTHVPELVGEVKSRSDTWNEVFEKVEEYLILGVSAVLVVDPETKSVLVLRRGQDQQTFGESDTLVVPDVLPGFAVPVARLFS